MSQALPITAALDRVRARIDAAARRAERDPASVRLIVVTKGVDVPRIREAIAAGVTDIGENRIQEALSKHDRVEGELNWHLIGHLQTNKARTAAAIFDAVHSVDSTRVARALAEHRPANLDPLAALVEVDFTSIATRTGVREEDVENLVRDVVGLPGLHLVGLMTIAPQAEPPAARTVFARLRALRDEVENATSWALPELSMGMSDDFDVAVEEGSTMVRVGRAIFGDRLLEATDGH